MAFSGPFTTTESKASLPMWSKTRKRYRQKAPYIDRLPYEFIWNEGNKMPNPWDLAPSTLPISSSFDPDGVALAKAYGSFSQEARETASLAVNLAERKQAVDMMASRASQILRFARNLRSFRFVDAARDLGLRVITAKDSRRYWRARVRAGSVDREIVLKKRLQSFGNNYLEFHFGWEPLVKDIGSVIEMLHDTPFKGLRRTVKGKGSSKGTKPSAPTSMADFDIETVAYMPIQRVQLIADIVIEDPNVFRLNQLGFVNPAVIAWELVPFSFVVDWFSNVGMVLSSYTDFVGMSLQNACTTSYAEYHDNFYYKGRDPNNWYGRIIAPYSERKAVTVRRSQGITMPDLVLRPPKWPSVVRGATAISLLSQFLGKH